jgi:type I restriction enzyme R subunit
MGKYLAYHEYKDTGVEWFPNVPHSWSVLPARRVFKQVRNPASPEDEQLAATQKYGVIPQRLFMEYQDQKVVLALAGTGNFKHVEKDDFVISLRSFQGGIERCHYVGCVSPAYKGKAATRIYRWVKLHPYNIEQKVAVIVEHFRQHVGHLLSGQAKAMVVTDSRKAAVRYKLAFDKYVAEKGYPDVHALVAFSGDVEDKESGPDVFNERNMNPGLKGRDLRDAFNTLEYQVMIAANKFQTGFDQPKLCAMYVDKKLNGVDCVQTLSRLNRIYPGKDDPFVLDFVNDPDDILVAFRPYYRTAELESVSDPNLLYDLQQKLDDEHIYTTQEVHAFAAAFFDPKAAQDKLSYHARPAVDRFRDRYRSAVAALKAARQAEREAEKAGDSVGLGNARKDLKRAGEDKDALDLFKKNLGTFVRFYEFMSQIVDYDDRDLEKLSVYARHLRPLLREERLDEEIDISSLQLTHYRLKKIAEHELKLKEDDGDYRLSSLH